MNLDLEQVTSVSGLPDEELEQLRRLVIIWRQCKTRNLLRKDYYTYKNRLKDFGISIPDTLRGVETVIGWPAKAVDALAVRSRFEDFIFEEGNINDDLKDIVRFNRLPTLYRQAATSELICSCSFLTVSAGDTLKGEPKAIISAYSALFGSAEWDRRAKRIKAGLTVVDTEKDVLSGFEEPIWVNLFTDTDTWEIKKEGQSWTSRRVPHEMGRPMMEPLVFRPTLDRPFGRSRISRAVMSITDSAVREALRTEVGAEFYTSPQKYILGADENILEEKGIWGAYIGAFLALTRDEDGNIPQVGMFSQGSMQPHTDYIRSLAARFSGETSIPISELGVIHDNPASAEAIYAAKESLVCEADDMNAINGDSLCEIAKMALAIAEEKPLEELDEEEKNVMVRWKNPAMPSAVSQADAITKVISALPWVSESEVALEEYGFSSEQIRRMRSDKAKAEASAMIASQMQQTQENSKEATMYEISSVLKSYNNKKISYKNAITLFGRLGISEEEAASMLSDAHDVSQTIDEGEEGEKADENATDEGGAVDGNNSEKSA